MESTNLAPGLLLAMPQLADPNFSRSVVLMIEHSDEGSFGLVINHPLEIRASELFESLDMSWRGDARAIVWGGGPVSKMTGWVLHEPTGVAEAGNHGTIAITSQISLTTSPERLRAIGMQPPGHVRLLLGYSGWGPGQLAAEMARGAWLHTAASPRLVFDTPTDDIWSTAIESLGINPRDLFATGGGVN